MNLKNDNDKYKYLKVQEYIKNYIKKNSLRYGDQLPTESEIADVLDIHTNTVKYGLNNLSQEGLIYRERGRGTFVGRDMMKQEVHTIGLIIESVTHQSLMSSLIVKGVEEVVSKQDVSYLMGNSDNQYNKIVKLINQFEKREVSGIILMPLHHNFYKNYQIIELLNEHKIPFVFVDDYISGADIPYVTSDNEHGGFMITKHLIDLGHKDIAFIFESDCSTLEARFTGYRLALVNANITPSEDLIIRTNRRLEEAGERGMNILLERDIGFTAIVCSNDSVAAGAYKVLSERGLKVPDDISLVGYDGFHSINEIPISMTTILQNPLAMGKSAARLLLDMVRNQGEHRNIIIKNELVIGQSTKRLNR